MMNHHKELTAAMVLSLFLPLGCADDGSSTTGTGGGNTTSSTSGSGGNGSTTSSSMTTTTGSGGSTTTGSGGSGGSLTGTGGAGGSGGSLSGTGGAGGSGGSPSGTGGAGGASTGNGGASTGNGGAGGMTGAGGASTGGGGGSGGCSQASDCDNGVFCDGAEACVNGACVAGTAACDDGIACTIDNCNEGTHMCLPMPINSVCDDGIACNGMEQCDVVAGCVSGAPLDCDDNIPCTADFCDTSTDSCAHVENDGLCNDSVFCNGNESCDAQLGCVSGAPPTCNDGIACTSDSCDAATDACKFTPMNAACDDGQLCNGTETCSATSGCQAGTPPTCDDGIGCTADSCSTALNQCVHATNDAACSDGSYCDGDEFCSAVLGCRPGIAPGCVDDGWFCTVETCDEPTMGCLSTPNNQLCGPGKLCKPGQPGVDADGCVTGTACAIDSQCQDGNLCNGAETCANGICSAGTPVVCDDGVSCTFDSCNPATGLCEELENDAFCDDGLACDGMELCDASMGCIQGNPIQCADAFSCTTDFCTEPGTCVHQTNSAACSDGNPCNGDEVCSPTQGCVAGTGNGCADDGIACTVESCDPTTGCTHTPDDSLCPCGQTCDPAQGGCGSFCQVATCQGKVYACGDCIDNDGDCAIDSADDQCLGPCDNTEDSFYGGIPGQNNSPCKSDCYFDQDTGSGNDDCYWSHKCDPLEVAPSYPPESSQCEYNPNANIPGYSGSCANAYQTQSTTCSGYCGPLTPNGCDCFGCCEIPGAPTTVWLGSENPSGTGSCDLAHLTDPAYCKPCTQVAACLNTCEHCEICVGKPTLPSDCTQQVCPTGAELCGQPNQPDCPSTKYCVSGCCQPLPQ